MSADQGAMQQFQDMRGRFSRPDYTAVQQEFWEQQRRNKRSAPTPLQSGLTTPQEGGQSSQTARPQGASEDGPSLLQPFSFEDKTAVGLTAATHGVDINDQTAIKNWLAKPVQNNQQVFEMVRSYHRAVIRPEMYNLVLQLEAALKPVDKSVFKARQELQWLSADNRLAQKHQAGLQVLSWVAELHEAGPAYFHGGLDVGTMPAYCRLPEVPRLHAASPPTKPPMKCRGISMH